MSINNQGVWPLDVTKVANKVVDSGLRRAPNVLAGAVAVANGPRVESGEAHRFDKHVNRPSGFVFLRSFKTHASRGIAGWFRAFVGAQIGVWNDNAQYTSWHQHSVTFDHQSNRFIEEEMLEEVFGIDVANRCRIQRQSISLGIPERTKVGRGVQVVDALFSHTPFSKTKRAKQTPRQRAMNACVVSQMQPGFIGEGSKRRIVQQFEPRCTELQAIHPSLNGLWCPKTNKTNPAIARQRRNQRASSRSFFFTRLAKGRSTIVAGGTA